MNPKYLPRTLDGKINRIIEESGEVLVEIGKAGRFGLQNYPPEGGMNNAAAILNECADLRHAISIVENEIACLAEVVHVGDFGDKQVLIWTCVLITTREMRELVGDEEGDDEDFLAENKVIAVCAGEWHREALEWRFYSDPKFIE